MKAQNKVFVRRKFSCSQSELFDWLVQPELITLWFGPKDLSVGEVRADVRIGGEYSIELKKSPFQNFFIEGKYIEVNAPNGLAFTFQYRGLPTSLPKSIITIKLQSLTQNETSLSLTQDFELSLPDMDLRAKSWEHMFQVLEGKFIKAKEQKKKRESNNVKIVTYERNYRRHFKELNEEWISKFFKMEEEDHRILDHPEENIINKGGHIVVALYHDEPVGVCALIKVDHPEYDFELAKMGVSPKAQGKGIGWLLGKAIIDIARSEGARKIHLESNTILTPAISLYRKLGFQEVVGHATPYERCNIQMELKLN